MSDSKHTPGPWHAPHFADDATKCNCTSIVSEYYAGAICTFDINNGLRIGEGGNDAPPLEEAKANARLIASAPDLLAVVKALVQALEGVPSTQLSVAKARVQFALAAIAKAEGN